MRINTEFLNWATRMNSKQFHECTKREKNECPIKTLRKSQWKVLLEIRSYHCLPKIMSAGTILSWATSAENLRMIGLTNLFAYRIVIIMIG
jgi:hypothetical protein